MSLLTVAQSLATNVGIAQPVAVVGQTDNDTRQVLEFANTAGEEIARRVDWGALFKTATLTGDGTALAHSLPNDFARLSRGVCCTVEASIVRPLTRAEWSSLTEVEGTPRYFLLETDTIRFWPYLANGSTATLLYYSDAWAWDGMTTFNNTFQVDSDQPVFDEDLLLKGTIVRWRRQKGMDYADYEAEFEAAIQDFATFDDRARV